eukprot:6226218-Prymnesium_polylepis.1
MRATQLIRRHSASQLLLAGRKGSRLKHSKFARCRLPEFQLARVPATAVPRAAPSPTHPEPATRMNHAIDYDF